MVLFATESGIDQSKAAGIYVHSLLNLPAHCRVVELKQACYSGTAAIQLALPYLHMHPDKKILVIAADIARYGLNTTGESSQGGGAVAMVLSANPRILAIEPEFAAFTENAMDFWRPNYRDEALVEGKYSSKLYMSMLEKCWSHYQSISHRGLLEHAFYCYHTPVPKLVEKAHQYLYKINQAADKFEIAGLQQIQSALSYSREIGNSYTASMYIGLTSLLDNVDQDISGKRIGFYSYGSGCVAEFFSGIVQPHYRSTLQTRYHREMLAARKLISYDEYETFYTFAYNTDGQLQEIPEYDTGAFRLTKMDQHKRIYASTVSMTNISEAAA
jgi:hydroxymethylglutaryl-CoA synthase